MEIRYGKITACKAGGTAGSGSKTYKVSLPSAWVNKMTSAEQNGRIILAFDGETVTVRPEQSPRQFRDARLAQGHELLEIRYYNGDELCTLICADRTAGDLTVQNYTDQTVKTAFGNVPLPSWADLEAFLKERCVPRQRAGLREYLESLGLDGYDPLAIIQKTQGRMAEDDQWMEVSVIK